MHDARYDAKIKIGCFCSVFQFHWHFLRWVAGQITQTQNTRAQNTQNNWYRCFNLDILALSILALGILDLGISGLGSLGLGILGWRPLGDRKFNLQILGLSIFIIFCSWPSRFLTFASYKNSNFGQNFFNFGYFGLHYFGFDN